MNQREAFVFQATSDYKVYQFLEKYKNDLSQCHSLHYLQMTTEKLAKAFLCHDDIQLKKSHKVLSKFIDILIRRKDILTTLGYEYDPTARFLSSIKKHIIEIEKINPAIANEILQSGGSGRNVEYPWKNDNDWIAPACYSFSVYEFITGSAGLSFLRMIERLINNFNSIK